MKPKRNSVVQFQSNDGRQLVGRTVSVGKVRSRVEVNAIGGGCAQYSVPNAHVDPYEDECVADFNMHVGPVPTNLVHVDGCSRC